MSDTPPHDAVPVNGRDRTPELVSSREKRRREDENEEDDRDAQRDRSHHRSSRRHRTDDDERDRERDQDRDRERERRHRRHREDETEEERRERHRRRDEETEEERRERRRRREEETEEEREERHRRRRERERERERSRRDSIGSSRRDRDRSRESHRSDVRPKVKELTREEKEAERERRDREMAEEKREAARAREARFAEMDRERELERRRLRDEERGLSRDRSPPRRRRGSPSYSSPAPPRDPATALLDEVERENRSIFISQLSARLTSHDLGMFFEDKLGRGAVRDARIVTDKVTRRSKGIGYVELDAAELVNRAIALTGTIVMGLPINVMLTESERNREPTGSNGQIARPAVTFGHTFPPLSTGLAIPQGLDVDAHRDAAIPYHRLYISNIAFSLSADDLRQVFEPFGEIEFVDLHIDFSGMKKGTGYVQYKELQAAQMALDAMAGFELAGRPIRVQTVQDRAYVATEQIEDNGNYGTRLDANQRQQLMFKLARAEPTVNLALSAPKPVTVPSKTPQMNPTPFIIVSNMFNPDEETERNWDLDLAEDVKGEVESKYGKVKRIKVEKMSAGEVYIEFNEIDGATSAIKGLNGRFFGGRQLQASYISEALFKAHL
ncbi:RNA-binding protein 39 [Kwoniella mangroviensis CBS 10435]|uniref:RNA-binding protein 39 n=1 Tax=Kwoniella mangroviensis CBS 10435 TaxID=1331196 RepID=A0A1B9IP45_9TREE|nr:RNA-binding protein 39 [Kwoniella mangroviensis CBS 10435]